MQRSEKDSLLSKKDREQAKKREQEEEKQRKAMQQHEERIQQSLFAVSKYLEDLTKKTLVLQDDVQTMKKLYDELQENPRIYEFVSKYLRVAEQDPSFSTFIKNYQISEHFNKVVEGQSTLTNYSSFFADMYEKAQKHLEDLRKGLLEHMLTKFTQIEKSIKKLDDSMELITKNQKNMDTERSYVKGTKKTSHP